MCLVRCWTLPLYYLNHYYEYRTDRYKNTNLKYKIRMIIIEQMLKNAPNPLLHIADGSKRCSHCIYRKYRPNAKHKHELNQCQISGHNLTDVENHSCEHYKPIPNVC